MNNEIRPARTLLVTDLYRPSLHFEDNNLSRRICTAVEFNIDDDPFDVCGSYTELTLVIDGTTEGWRFTDVMVMVAPIQLSIINMNRLIATYKQLERITAELELVT